MGFIVKRLLSCLFLLSHSCIFGQEVTEVRSEVLGPGSFQEVRAPLIGPCSLGCAIGWELRASSHLAEQGKASFAAQRLQDGDSSTAWIEGAEGYGIGERLKIEFERGVEDSAKYPFYEIGLTNGYCKSKKLWKKHSRVKRMRLSKNGEPRLLLKFRDSYYPQVFKWDPELLKVGNGDWVTLEIEAVYEGELERTAISDIYFMGAH